MIRKISENNNIIIILTHSLTASKRSVGSKTAVFQNHGEVKLIGGSIVRKNVENTSDTVDFKDLRAIVQKPTDNLQLGGSVEYQGKKASAQYLSAKTSVGGKQKAVRKRTWTKEEAQEIGKSNFLFKISPLDGACL